jgi:K+-transporting ATPase c subunit
VVKATGLSEQKVRELVAEHTSGGLSGTVVNVTALNRALEAAK